MKKHKLFNSAYVPGSSPKEGNLEKDFEFPSLEEILQYKPTEAEIFPTRNCSENCSGCSVPMAIRWTKEERKPTRWWVEFIQKIAKGGVKYVMIMGGEPTIFPGIEEIVKAIIRAKINGAIFTDGIPLKRNPERLEKLIMAGLLKITIFSSVDYLVKKEPSREMGKDMGTSRYHKAFYGLGLLKALKKRGAKAVVANIVLTPDNLEQIIPLYKELEKVGVYMTLCTLQWQCHFFQRRDSKDFSRPLTWKHIPKIEEVINFILEREKRKIKEGKERTVVNSSRFFRAMPYLGVAQPISCNNFSGPPGVFAVLPDGSLRHCPVISNLEDVLRCPGCHYGFRDRDPKFEDYLKAMKIFEELERIDFPNIVHQI